MPALMRAQTYVHCLVEKIGCPSADFEGEITVTSLQTSSGGRVENKLSFDGKHVDRKMLKNGNMHLHDTRMHIHYITNIVENRCIVYSDETRSGVEYPLDKRPEISPENIATMDEAVTVDGMTVDTTLIYSKKSAKVLNMNCEASKTIYVSHYNSALATQTSGESKVEIETWRCTEPSFEGMVLKEILDLKYELKTLMRIKSTTYFSAVVSDIKKQIISDEEFQVPSGYQITKVRTFYTAQKKLKDIIKETEKILKKKKQHPSQLEDNDTFETESEWED